jgi:6-phosphogluconolactonase
MLRKLFSIVMVLTFGLAGSLAAFNPVLASSHDNPGAVFVATNAPSGNLVLAYDRAADGSLTFAGAFATGGKGSGVGVTVPPDPLGSQNSLLLSPDHRWLFAVNAGINEISTFRVTGNGLKLASKVSSGGSYPVSLAFRDGVLYVLNAAGQGNITGFSLAENGRLQPIKDSTRWLGANTPADGAQPQILESPAQVGFSPDGRYLMVTDKGGMSGVGRILVFRLHDGTLPAAKPVITNTAGPVPFSFVFDAFGHLVVVDAAATTITSYGISGSGVLATLSTVSNHQPAVCWIASNGAYLFTDNTGAGTISALRPSANGSLTLLNATAAITGAGSLPLDIAISAGGQYIYSLEVGAGKIGIQMISPDGSLAPAGSIAGLPVVGGEQGIAAY